MDKKEKVYPTPEKDNIQTRWKATSEQVMQTAKWLKKGTLVTVDASFAPLLSTIDGQYGKRQVYMINTREYGLIYVSPLQLVRIADQLEESHFKNVTVEI